MELLAPVVASGASFDPLAFDPAAFMLTLILFLSLFGLLLKFAWNPILNALDAREKRIGDAVSATESARDEAQRLRAEIQQQINDNEKSIAARIEEGRLAADRQGQEILAKAKAEAEAERDRALRDIEVQKQQALAELRDESVRLSKAIAEKVLVRELNADDHRRLAGEVLAALGPQGSN